MYLLFDIGGTHTRIAISKNTDQISEYITKNTPQGYREGLHLIIDASKQLIGENQLRAVAGGIAGPFDKEKTSLFRAPHLHDWAEKPIRRDLEDALHVPVFLQNDTALGGLGEAVFGAGKKENIVAYIAIGTGVGGVRIVNKTIDTHVFGFEIGHQIISCTPTSEHEQIGYLEEYLSGSALEQRFHKKPAEITDASVWQEYAYILACALNNTIVYWSPDIIVLGGGMVLGPHHIPMERAVERLKTLLKIFPSVPPIVTAALGDRAGLFGALALLQHHSVINPHDNTAEHY